MAKEVSCDCGFMLRANTDDEIVRHVQLHGKEIHNMEMSREQALAMAKPIEATIDA